MSLVQKYQDPKEKGSVRYEMRRIANFLKSIAEWMRWIKPKPKVKKKN